MRDYSGVCFLCVITVKMIVSLQGPGVGPLMIRHPSLGLISKVTKDMSKFK